MPAATRSAKRTNHQPGKILEDADGNHVTELQLEVIELFVRAEKVLGLPKSIGEIYGLIYISPNSLPLDTFVVQLGISKGSASQGLRFLRKLGAVQRVEISNERRDHFIAVAELKQLATGFIRGELLPHLDNGSEQLERLSDMAAEDNSEHSTFNRRRIARLQAWRQRGGSLLKLVEKFLR